MHDSVRQTITIRRKAILKGNPQFIHPEHPEITHIISSFVLSFFNVFFYCCPKRKIP